MGTILTSTVCHYCGPDGSRATTEDHVVPRALLPKPQSTIPYWFRGQNVVPACLHCNGVKADLRSSCMCPQCVWCWNVAAKMYLPLGYSPRVVDVAMLSHARRLGIGRRMPISGDLC